MTKTNVERKPSGSDVIAKSSLKQQPQSAAASSAQDALNDKMAEKMHQRRHRWQWNLRLLFVSSIALFLCIAGATVSYFYHSSQAADTFLARAETAASEGNFREQSRWLRRYSMLRPDDPQALVTMAVSADRAADLAAPSEKQTAVNFARQSLSEAIARLGLDDEDQINELRGRLIERLLQLGGAWFREAEYQICELKREPEETQSLKWMATAIIGQYRAGLYGERKVDQYKKDVDYWKWLANQPAAFVLIEAIEANPTDLKLIAVLVDENGRESSELFAPLNDRDKQRKNTLIQQVIASIENNEDSRSRLILYQHRLDAKEKDSAEAMLLSVCDQVLSRLESESVDADSEETGPTGFELPDEYWDFVLVFESARISAENNQLDRAIELYERLVALDQIDAIPLPTVESVYLALGRLYDNNGEREKAFELWRRGLDQLNPNNLDFRGLVAFALVKDEDEQASKAVREYDEAILFAKNRLTRATDADMSRPARIQFAGRIESAEWRAQVLRGFLADQNGDRRLAINLLQSALNDRVDVSVPERIQAASTLAALYQLEGFWDQAATAYDRVIEFAPDDIELRAKAAEAWMRSGNRLQANNHWKVVGSSQSLSFRIASAEAAFNFQLRLEPNDRDFSGVRAAVNQIRGLVDQNFGESGTQNAKGTERIEALARLDVLELLLPVSGGSNEERLTSDEFAAGILELSAKYPEDSGIQAFCAERLAEAGWNEQANVALERLTQLSTDDSAASLIVRARILAQAGEPVEAARQLIEEAKRNNSRELNLLLMAASFASRADDPELAYESLALIPEQKRSATTLFDLSLAARTLPKDSRILQRQDGLVTPEELSRSWEMKVQEFEGKESGTLWRFLKASRLINDMRFDPNRVQRNDRRLEDAKQLVREILSFRPRWGQAISLEGWILAIERRPEKAVEQLRRGIAAGDRRLQTRQRLWEQLILLDRVDEAEMEIKAAAFSSNVNEDQFTMTRIELASKKGDPLSGLDIAESTAERNPDDVLGHVVVCMTASTLAKTIPVSKKRNDVIQRGRVAIEKAFAAADPPELAVYSANIGLELAAREKDRLKQAIDKVRSSKLKEFERLTLEARGLVGLGEYSNAVQLLTKADQLQPTSQIQWLLANIYHLMKEPEKAIDALREAQKRFPESEVLRNRLARALATRDGKNVNWNELGELLSSAEEVTAENRFNFAILLSTLGNSSKREEAAVILRQLIREQIELSDDASRLLAALLRKEMEASSEPLTSLVQQRRVSEIQVIYESLAKSQDPEVSDLYRFADFLLSQESTDNFRRIKELIERIRGLSNGSYSVLDLSLRLAAQANDETDVNSVVQTWVEGIDIDSGARGESELSALAGVSLLRAGFIDQGLQWFEKAYQKDPTESLANYTAALLQLKRHEQAAALCVSHFRKYSDAQSATILAKALIIESGLWESNGEYETVLEQALTKHDKNVALLETVATLRLQSGQLEDAIFLYETVEKLEPLRVSVYNNHAMALSELDGRAAEGLPLIDRAIKLAGEAPELLDTKGAVLMKAGRPEEASRVFRQAVTLSPNPRFQFHLIVALLELGESEEARRQWADLDLDALDVRGLTSSEKEKLSELKVEFETTTSTL